MAYSFPPFIAVLFFALCTIFELFCVLLYAYIFPKLDIVKHYRSKAASEGSKTVSADLAAGGIQTSLKPEVYLLPLVYLWNKMFMEFPLSWRPCNFYRPKKIQNNWGGWATRSYYCRILIMQLICFWYMSWHCLFSLDSYLKTLEHTVWAGGKSQFNLVFLEVISMANSLWILFYVRYALVLIAMYNVCDLIGRFIPLLKFLKLESRKGLMIAILSRFLLIPAFYFTAKYGDQGWMIMLTSLLGLTNGYLTVCVLTSAPKGYKVCSQHDSHEYLFPDNGFL